LIDGGSKELQKHSMTYYLSFAFGAILFVGGAMGYLKGGSTVSLLASLPLGLAYVLGGFLIKNNLENPVQTGPTGYLISWISSILLFIVGIIRFNATRKFMPAGLLLLLGLIGSVVYYLQYTSKKK
jgi:uncharacterized membrane protein (UPF0136 family)